MSIRIHEISGGGRQEGTPEYLDALKRVHDTFGDDFSLLKANVTHPLDIQNSTGVALAIHRPIERINEADNTFTLHPLGLGNAPEGHQLLYGQLLAEALGQKVVTISAPYPRSNFNLSPRDRWRIARGDATPYVDHIIDALQQHVPVMESVAITTSTQPGSAIAPRLASRLQEKSCGRVHIDAIEIADPATVTSRQTTQVLDALTAIPHEAYADPLDNTIISPLYRRALNAARHAPTESLDPAELLEDSFNYNVGKKPRRPGLLLSNAALAAYMGHQRVFDDLAEALYHDEETTAVIASSDSPVAPIDIVREGAQEFAKEHPHITAQLSIVAVRGVARNWWDNPGNLARLRSYRR